MNTPEHSGQAAHPHAVPPKAQRRKLHQDWRLWLMVVLMLAAMTIYLLTLDLR
jgi:hypothetical protein